MMSGRKQVVTIVWVAMLLAGSLLSFGQATPPCTIYVHPGESIQAAIDQAPEGAVICLGSGTWEENIKISKSVKFSGLGPDQTHIRSANCPVVSISDNAGAVVQIEGVSMGRCDDSGSLIPLGDALAGSRGAGEKHPPYQVVIEGSVRAVFTRCRISGTHTGILVRDSAEATLRDSSISQLTAEGSAKVTLARCKISGENAEASVSVQNSAEVILQSSFISGHGGTLILAWDNAKVVLQSTALSSEGLSGIVVGASANVTLQDSTLSGAAAIGLLAQDSAAVTIVNSTITSVYGSGLVAQAAAHVVIDGATISNNQEDGIVLCDMAILHIVNSRITGNHGHGICVESSACADCDNFGTFSGQVTGKSNFIPGPGEMNGNEQGACCPPYPGDPWPMSFIRAAPGLQRSGVGKPDLYFPNSNIHIMKAVRLSSFEDYFYGATYVQDVVNNGGPGKVFVSVALKIHSQIVASASIVFNIGDHETVTLEAALYFNPPVRCDWGITGYSLPKQVLDWRWHVAQSSDRPQGKITIIRRR